MKKILLVILVLLLAAGGAAGWIWYCITKPYQGFASEGVFVPVGAGEDEGYVLAPVYDASTGKSHVRVIDAQKFAAPPVAVIELPVRIPFGFHGDFFSQ